MAAITTMATANPLQHGSYPGEMPDDEIDRLRNQLKALHRRMRREQTAIEGLSAPALEVLIAVGAANEPIRPGQLAADLQMTSPNIAAALRSLESSSLITRRPDPHDGRKAIVELTPRGGQLIAESRENWRGWLRKTIDAALSDSEQRLLFVAGDLMQRLADYDPTPRATALQLPPKTHSPS